MTTSPTLCPVGPGDVHTAARTIAGQIRRTPLLDVTIGGRPVLLKLEHLQRGGSFKLRGALNALLRCPRPDQVITASGGNHGLGVATAAAMLGLPATVFVPETVPPAKARRIEATGARLIRHGTSYAQAAAAAMAAATSPDSRYLSAYDDPDVIAGQGTVALEVLADAPDVDTIAVAVGGGGLAAGTALVADGRTTVAVEPEHCRSVHDALAAGRPVDSPIDSVAASALGTNRAGAIPFEILNSPTTVSVLVSDAEILAAVDLLWEEFRLAVEPAGAAGFAAWYAGRIPGARACVVLCGANTEWSHANG